MMYQPKCFLQTIVKRKILLLHIYKHHIILTDVELVYFCKLIVLAEVKIHAPRIYIKNLEMDHHFTK